MKALQKTNELLYKVIMYSVSVVLAIMIIVAFVEVVRRYVFGASFIWADDFIRYLIVYVGFVGGAAAFRDDNLASLDLLTQYFPHKLRVACEIVVNTIVTAMIIFLMYYSIGAISAPSIKFSIGIGLKIALWIPYLAMPIGYICMILFSIEKYISLFGKLRKGGTEA